MRNVRIPGAVNNVGASQGYVGISVLSTSEEVELNGQVSTCIVSKVVYEVTEEEKQALLEGGRLVLTLLMKPPIVPHRLEVVPV
jgi:hypothetical protein